MSILSSFEFWPLSLCCQVLNQDSSNPLFLSFSFIQPFPSIAFSQPPSQHTGRLCTITRAVGHVTVVNLCCLVRAPEFKGRQCRQHSTGGLWEDWGGASGIRKVDPSLALPLGGQWQQQQWSPKGPWNYTATSAAHIYKKAWTGLCEELLQMRFTHTHSFFSRWSERETPELVLKE